MNLTYEQRIELLEIVKEEHHKQWKTVLEIDAKFKGNDESMTGDKENYWVKKQAEAYDRKQLLEGIRTELTLSL